MKNTFANVCEIVRMTTFVFLVAFTAFDITPDVNIQQQKESLNFSDKSANLELG